MKKTITILGFAVLVACASPLFALDIHWAGINIVNNVATEPITETEKSFPGALKDAILAADRSAFLVMPGLETIPLYTGKPVRSIIDAREMCESLSVEYLFYGYFIKEDSYYDVTLYFYARKEGEHKKVFYARSDRVDFDGMAADLGHRVAAYFYALFNVDIETGNPPEPFDGWYMEPMAGWWFPTGEWANLLTGTFEVRFGAGLLPGTLFYTRRDVSLFPRYALEIGYGLAIAAPDVQETYYHSFEFAAPAHLCLLFGRELAFLGAGISAQVDAAVQVRMYEDSVLELSTGFGLFVDIGYEHWFGDERTICLGIRDRYSFVFYAEFFMKNSLTLYGTFRFPFEPKSEVTP